MVTDAKARGGHDLDRIEPCFDDPRVVANAGLLLASTLAVRLGLERLVDASVRLPGRSGAARAGAKVLSLVSAMLLGADSIDDCDLLRSGRDAACAGPPRAGALDAGDVPA
jgi:hypothetical protein